MQLEGSVILFERKVASDAKKALQNERRIFKGKPVFLDRWSPLVGYFQSDAHAREAWVRVMCLPVHYE